MDRENVKPGQRTLQQMFPEQESIRQDELDTRGSPAAWKQVLPQHHIPNAIIKCCISVQMLSARPFPAHPKSAIAKSNK
jgi:hypothetical protein